MLRRTEIEQIVRKGEKKRFTEEAVMERRDLEKKQVTSGKPDRDKSESRKRGMRERR